jgi:hypothetical protein
MTACRPWIGLTAALAVFTGLLLRLLIDDAFGGIRNHWSGEEQ